MRRRLWLPVLVTSVSVVGALLFVSFAAGASPVNVRVTLNGTDYVSADYLGGTGGYSDGVLTRCGSDLRQQNEPTLAIDPRDTSVWAAGANDYCTVPTAGDAWTGYYRSTDGGANWTDSLVPGYPGDTSPQADRSPLARLAAAGAHAAGDPVVAWDGEGRLFFMGNNFSRGVASGRSGITRQNIGSIWVTTYQPSNSSDHSTDGSKFVGTVLVAANVPGLGQFTDKTALGVDPGTGDVYAAWSTYHGGGCNEIDLSRSTDHGASFSKPMKISTGLCLNQAPSFAFGPDGQVYVSWEATSSPGRAGVTGAAFTVSSDHGQSFSKPRLAVAYTPFVSGQFSGNGARECGDGALACPSGFTFPRFDLAGPYLAADNTNTNPTIVMAFQAAQSDGQGQIEYSVSSDGGATWSAPALLAPSTDGHQFFPYITASNGRVSAIWYDSRGDSNYAAIRPPCNSGSGQVYACLNVYYASSTDGGSNWSDPQQITDAPTNPNYEQFGHGRVPFFGDYITVAAVGDTIGAVWTDQRDTVGASDSSADNDGADVAGDPETGGSCASSLDDCFDGTGGLDQNIYAAAVTP